MYCLEKERVKVVAALILRSLSAPKSCRHITPDAYNAPSFHFIGMDLLECQNAVLYNTACQTQDINRHFIELNDES